MLEGRGSFVCFWPVLVYSSRLAAPPEIWYGFHWGRYQNNKLGVGPRRALVGLSARPGQPVVVVVVVVTFCLSDSLLLMVAAPLPLKGK